MINVKKHYMSELEKERLKNYVADMSQDEIKFLVTLLDSDIMLEEVARREKLAEIKFTAISGLLKIK